MNEENDLIEEPFEEPPFESVEDEWKAPPIPEKIPVEKKELPQMSEVSTLVNIFFEPGRVFEDLRRKPRFLIGLIIIVILTTAFAFSLQAKLGEDRIRRFAVQQADKSPQFANATPEQKEQGLKLTLLIQKVTTYILPLLILLTAAIVSFIYWLSAKAMGGDLTYFGSVSVWVYSTFPVVIVMMVANFLLLFLKSADDIDIATSQNGLVKANPTAFFDGKEMPVLTTLISTVDIFVIWGLILAAIGISKVGKLSIGSASAIVIILTLIGITLRVLFSLLNGVPM